MDSRFWSSNIWDIYQARGFQCGGGWEGIRRWSKDSSELAISIRSGPEKKFINSISSIWAPGLDIKIILSIPCELDKTKVHFDIFLHPHPVRICWAYLYTVLGSLTPKDIWFCMRKRYWCLLINNDMSVDGGKKGLWVLEDGSKIILESSNKGGGEVSTWSFSPKKQKD